MAKIIRVEDCWDCPRKNSSCKVKDLRLFPGMAKTPIPPACPLEDAPGTPEESSVLGTVKESLTVKEPIRVCIGGNEHDLQPVYSYGQTAGFNFPADMPVSKIESILDAMKSKTYEGHVCRKCGARVMRNS